ncbi:MAG: hypothetical protein RH860_09725 [Cytophagales bacterium]
MKIASILLFSILLIQNGYTQDSSQFQPKIFLSISPQYIAINGTRVDLEKRFKESAHALLIAPTYYFGFINENHIFQSYFKEYELNGFGFELGHKIYAEKNWLKDINWYQSYSITYNRLSFDYSGMDWQPLPGDPNLLVLREKGQTLTIDQFGLSTYIGALIRIDKNFYTDVYFGIGAKRSFANDSSTDKFAEDDFSDGFINYNFTGALLRAGFKIGMAF